MSLADFFHSVATGPKRRRELLTPVGLPVFGGTLALVIFGGLYTDRWARLPALLPGVVGVVGGVSFLAAGASLCGWCVVRVFGALLGLGLLLHSAGIALIWTPAYVLVHLAELKLVEEPELVRRFGSAYADYRAQVPMFIPRLRRYRSPGTPSKSG